MTSPERRPGNDGAGGSAPRPGMREPEPAGVQEVPQVPRSTAGGETGAAPPERREYRIAATNLPPNGHAVRLDVGGIPVAVFNVSGTLYAIDAVCPHAGGPLDEGEVEAAKVTCPWHGSIFDLATGAVESPPAERGVTAYSVHQEGTELVLTPRAEASMGALPAGARRAAEDGNPSRP